MHHISMARQKNILERHPQHKKYIWFIQDVQNDMTFIPYACKIVFIYNIYVELERRKVSFKRKFVASI